MYTQLSVRHSTARRKRRCIWCGDEIPAGSKYVREIGVYYGDLQRLAMHEECKSAADKFFAGGENEFEPYQFKRGTCEER